MAERPIRTQLRKLRDSKIRKGRHVIVSRSIQLWRRREKKRLEEEAASNEQAPESARDATNEPDQKCVNLTW